MGRLVAGGRLRRARIERSGSDRVTLCSFHRAKGLEWETVWVAGLEHGLVPIGRAASPEAEQEERRLLYVALTRAATELRCSWARHRTFGTHPVRRDPSPWLELILMAGASDGGETQSSPSSGWRDQLQRTAPGPARGVEVRSPAYGTPTPRRLAGARS